MDRLGLENTFTPDYKSFSYKQEKNNINDKNTNSNSPNNYSNQNGANLEDSGTSNRLGGFNLGKHTSLDESHDSDNIDYYGQHTPEIDILVSAARHGDLQTILTILEGRLSGSKLDINAPSDKLKSYGWTALHWGCYMGHIQIVQLLLELGASPNVQNDQGDTPMHKATYTNRTSIVSLLLKHNADVSIINALGQTALKISENPDIIILLEKAEESQVANKEANLLNVANKGDLSKIQEVLESQSPPNINCRQSNGNTALHIASYKGHAHLIIYLMHQGIDINLKNNENKTALDLAKNPKTRQLLQVNPKTTSVETLHSLQGLLLRKYLLNSFKLVWAVVNEGTFEIFQHKTKIPHLSKKNLIFKRSLRNCRIQTLAKDLLTFKIVFGDIDAFEIFRIPVDGRHFDESNIVQCELTREMWIQSVIEHIAYVEKRSLTVDIDINSFSAFSEKDRVKTVSEDLKLAEAHMGVLEKHVDKISLQMNSITGRINTLEPDIANLARQLKDTVTLANQTKTQLISCLTSLRQQDDMSQLLAKEVEKNRVLEESLKILENTNNSLQNFYATSSVMNMNDISQMYAVGDIVDLELDGLNLMSPPVPNEDFHDALSMMRTPLCNPNADEMEQQWVNSDFVSTPYRSTLPVPAPNVEVSVWSILKDSIGKDLSKITMPVFLNEPLSMLQKVGEGMECIANVRKALQSEDSLIRIQIIASSLIKAQITHIHRLKKPFNPVLGETYEFIDELAGIRLVAEQVSHHPPISAWNCSNDDYEACGNIHSKISFWGKSIEIKPIGSLTIRFKNGDIYTSTNVSTVVHNIIVGKMWVEKYGIMEVTNHKTGDKCVINFKPAGWFGKDIHWVEGYVVDSQRQHRYIIRGKWTEQLWSFPVSKQDSLIGNSSIKNNRQIDNKNILEGGMPLYESPPTKESSQQEYYNFTPHSMKLNQLIPGMEKTLPPTDSRFREDIRFLEEGRLDDASNAKHRIEVKQRTSRKFREESKITWMPLWFELKQNTYTGKDEWTLTKPYWDRNYAHCPDLF